MASIASQQSTLPERRPATMKNEKNTVQFRIACYMRVGNKEQLSPEEKRPCIKTNLTQGIGKRVAVERH